MNGSLVTTNLYYAAFLASHSYVGLGKIYFQENSDKAMIEVFWSPVSQHKVEALIAEYASQPCLINLITFNEQRRFICSRIYELKNARKK